MIDFLKNKKIFKLVCAAGNEDADEVEKLVYIYAKAGVRFFDLCAKKEIIQAARAAVQKTGLNPKEFFYCVSLGIKGDPHIEKAMVDTDLCSKCFKCLDFCNNDALVKYDYPHVNVDKCIGCGICFKNCPNNAIFKYSKELNIEKVLRDLRSLNIDCIEFHAVSEDEDYVMDKWHLINSNFDGLLSICVDRSKLSDTALITRLKKMLAYRTPYTTVIQADGVPMSGVDDDYKTTLQAISTAQIVQRATLPAFLMISGGTNSKTSELANLFELDYNGIAVGSYARKIVKEYISNSDFWQNQEIQTSAIEVAQELVKKLI